MKIKISRHALSQSRLPFLFFLCMVTLSSLAFAEEMKLNSAIVFNVKTNLFAVQFDGNADPEKVLFELTLQTTESSLMISEVSVTIPLEALSTGIKVRDKHMKEKIFQTQDGQQPPILFKSQQNSCVVEIKGGDCTLNGELEIAGRNLPTAIPLHVEQTEGTWKASGQMVILLDAFQIKPPGYMGVKVNNAVTVQYEVW
ncbi:MAG: YceI family protein [SAR324 cluster bacterium]|nr:YceI family protein [SAR324 cluster bacterium]